MSESPVQLKQKLKDIAGEAMLDAAESCMIRSGYAATTMQEIAAAAGCAAGTLYLHFKNKDELLKAVIDRHALHIFRSARSAVEQERDPVRKLQAGNRAFFEYAAGHRPFMRVFFEAVPLRYRYVQQLVGGKTQAENRAYDALEVQAIREAQAMGRIRGDIPAERLQVFSSDFGMSICEELVSKDDASLEEYVALYWGLISGGLGVVEERKP
jgi:AcrR family transcriptional regulator